MSSNSFIGDGVSISSQSQVKDAAPSKRRKQVGDEDEGEKEDNTAPQASTSAVVVEDSVEPASATGEDGAEVRYCVPMPQSSTHRL